MSADLIEVVVLDLAGTTVKDPGVVEAAVRSATGARFETETFHAYRGGSKFDMLAALVGEADAPEALETFEGELMKAITGGAIAPLPHAEEALHRLAQAGIRTCLSTGFSANVREALLASLGWARLVDLTLSPGADLRGRPWPDLVLAAAIQLQATDMSNVAVVGDTANDVLAARRAHTQIAAAVLTGAHDRPTLEAAGPTHLLGHVGEFADLVIDRRASASASL